MGSLLEEPPASAPPVVVAASPAPVPFPGETVDELDPRTLVDHDRFLPATATVEEAYRTFQATRFPYLPVLDADGAPLGLCSRGQIGFLLGSQYGFALYAKQAIARHLLPRFLAVGEEAPIRQILEEALGRAGEEFHHDVVLVDRAGRFVGVLAVRALAGVQSMLVREQMDDLARQRRDLAANNHDLFRSVNELRQSQARYRILFEHSPVGVALLSASGEIETLNESLAGWLGTGAGSNLVEAVEPKDRAALRGALGRADAASAGDATEVWLRADLDLGRERPRRLLQVTLRGIAETGQVCACCLDVTQERALTRAGLQREKQAFLDSLMGGIAHELNNKIHPILGFSDLLRDGAAPPEQQRHYADVIARSASDCARIVRQLLQFCQPAREEKVACDLRLLAEETAAFLHFRVRERKATLHVDLGEAPLPLLADPAQVKQIFLNLLLNALDAMERAPVREIRLTLRAEGNRAVARIADTGEGIRPEILDRIFDPFFTTKAQDKGTGLGLSVCQGIAKAHHGEIQVESVPGEGATFSFCLPLQAGGAPPDAEVPARPAAPAVPLAPQPSRRALVIDDEPFVGGFIQEVLKRRFGFTVERAANGALAVEKLEAASYDLVLCDVLMPVMNGVEVMRWLRVHQPERLENFLFVTGHDGGEERAAEIAASGLPVLSKPFTAATLSEKVSGLPFLAAR